MKSQKKDGDIPYKQVIEALDMLISQFGREIYLETQRFSAMVADMVANDLKEKNVLESAIALGLSKDILEIYQNAEDGNAMWEQAYHSIEEAGFEKEWCAALLFMFSYPLKLDSRKFYPVRIEEPLTQKNSSEETNYDTISNEELESLSDEGDAEASLVLGLRYYTGNRVEQDYGKAFRFFRRADALGNAVAQYNLGVM